MSRHGYELGVDLADLYAVGRYILPELESTYATLNRDVARTLSEDSEAFKEYGPVGDPGSLESAWTNLRDLLQDYLGTSANNMDAAAAAIVSIADNYASTDGEAAKTLHSIWYDDSSGHPVMRIPDRYLEDSSDSLPQQTTPDVRMSERTV
jgi:hypothetical protein